MSGTKEIKDRIESVRDTQKITNAMYLIASTKLRKARAELDRTRPYFDALRSEIKRVFRTVEGVESRYFYPGDDHPLRGTYAYLVITADKGLAGMYNQNVLREAQRLLNEHADAKLFVVGEYGRQYFAHHQIPVERSFLYTAQNPTMQRAREISSTLLDFYDSGQVQKIFIIYTDMKNAMTEEAKSTRLLPFHRQTFASRPEEKAVKTPFRFEPSIETVLDTLIPSYVSGFLYSALVDSFCSEQNARMTAMRTANDNAEALLATLSSDYQRLRQAEITQEITEITAGAAAQRRNARETQTL